MPDDLFSDTKSGDENDYYKILRELTNKGNVGLFSELSDSEGKAFTRLEFFRQLLEKTYNRKDILDVDLFIEKFLQHRVSKERKSRKEFVQAFGSERTGQIDKMAMTNTQGNRFIR